MEIFSYQYIQNNSITFQNFNTHNNYNLNVKHQNNYLKSDFKITYVNKCQKYYSMLCKPYYYALLNANIKKIE